jgi:hypothetical protein
MGTILSKVNLFFPVLVGAEGHVVRSMAADCCSCLSAHMVPLSEFFSVTGGRVLLLVVLLGSASLSLSFNGSVLDRKLPSPTTDTSIEDIIVQNFGNITR